MSRVFVIADLHFGHRKVADLRGKSDDDLIERWNAVVTKRDVVYVLGDVFRIGRVPELLGIKKLVLGNHDRLPMARYLECFSRVAAMFEYDGCLLTHMPVHPNQQHRYRLNVHGHMHNHRVKVWRDAINGQDGYYADDPFYRCVSAEQTGYTPVLLNPIVRIGAPG